MVPAVRSVECGSSKSEGGNAALTGRTVHVFQELLGSRHILPATLPLHEPPGATNFSFLDIPAGLILPNFSRCLLWVHNGILFVRLDVFKGTEGIVLAKVNTRNSQRGFQYPRNNHAIPHKWGETRGNLLFSFPGFYHQTITPVQKYKVIFLSLLGMW